ncbi:tRNA pseudouridine synthase A, mitochondrial [Trichinella nelsoni]|uniref:tRNA pseudouridine synthase A, mitochondrial n=1 Tax=Trichinella nelsoni TaxID=6336 RepID=A0A0V0RP63_9BILA|nr:tRNA pseudouridine synthase A, mitochondrial [Trichinella nelsoni]
MDNLEENSLFKKKKRKLHTYEKAWLNYKHIQEEKEKRKQEKEQKRKNIEAARERSKLLRKEKMKYIYKKTRKGQPKLGYQIEWLLKKIENQNKVYSTNQRKIMNMYGLENCEAKLKHFFEYMRLKYCYSFTPRLCEKYFCQMSSELKFSCNDAINSGTDFELNNQKRQKLENDEETRKIMKAEPTETVRIKRYKYAMFLAYRGKNYHGMQVNPNVPTVEKYIMEALQKLNLITVDQVVQPSLFKFQRAARTDKGVSAIKQICSLLLPTIEGKENDTVNLLNGLQRATKSFDSKKWCDCRSYSYTLPSYCFRHQSDLERDKFRLDNKDIEEINRILMQYVGTHNFYNFTSGKLHKDESCKRFIIRCECGKRFLYNNIEYLTVDIKGQSFLIHQIRKMIGFCVSLIRGDLDPCLQQKVWQNERIKVPKAPSLGLVLEEPHYEHYNKRFQATHQRLCWDIYQEKCDEFKQAYIIKDILETDESEKIFEEWLTYLTEKFWNENDVDNVSIVGHSDNVQTDGKSSLKEKV